MKKLFLQLGLLASLGGCTCAMTPVSPEEMVLLKENFKREVTEAIEREGKTITHIELENVRQTSDNEVLVGYVVTYSKFLENKEKVTDTFHNQITLRRMAKGLWHAQNMKPGELTVEFSEGMQINKVNTKPN